YWPSEIDAPRLDTPEFIGSFAIERKNPAFKQFAFYPRYHLFEASSARAYGQALYAIAQLSQDRRAKKEVCGLLCVEPRPDCRVRSDSESFRNDVGIKNDHPNSAGSDKSRGSPNTKSSPRHSSGSIPKSRVPSTSVCGLAMLPSSAKPRSMAARASSVRLRPCARARSSSLRFSAGSMSRTKRSVIGSPSKQTYHSVV